MSLPVVTGVRITQDNATVSDIEAVSQEDKRDWLSILVANEAVSEAFVLQTCIRCELYVVTDSQATSRRVLSSIPLDLPETAAVWMDHETSLRHLLRVAAGLESLVTGEQHVQGQVRDAYKQAKSVGTVGAVLEPALLKALHIGEKARSETTINDGPTSIGGAAVSLAQRECELQECRALVIGAGEMGTYAAQALSLRDVAELLLVDRSRHRAEHLASMLETDATVLSFDALSSVIAEVDLVISATASPDFLLTPAMVDPVDDLLVVDVTKPRDVHPATDRKPGVTVHDLDALESIAETAKKQRREATRRVETMVDEAMATLVQQHKVQRIDDVIAGIYKRAERIKRDELETALTKLESHGSLSDDQREDIEALADALVSDLLATPTTALRTAAANDDWELINTAVTLFDPQTDTRDVTESNATSWAESDGIVDPDPSVRVGEDDTDSR